MENQKEMFFIELVDATNENGNYVRNITKVKGKDEYKVTFTNEQSKIKMYSTERGALNAVKRIKMDNVQVTSNKHSCVDVFKVVTVPGRNPELVKTSVLEGTIVDNTGTMCSVQGSDEMFILDEKVAAEVFAQALQRTKEQLNERLNQIQELLDMANEVESSENQVEEETEVEASDLVEDVEVEQEVEASDLVEDEEVEQEVEASDLVEDVEVEHTEDEEVD